MIKQSTARWLIRKRFSSWLVKFTIELAISTLLGMVWSTALVVLMDGTGLTYTWLGEGFLYIVAPVVACYCAVRWYRRFNAYLQRKAEGETGSPQVWWDRL